MKYNFYLKHPKSKTETLILFSCRFKTEGKKFVYSTGEKINPKSWRNKFPIRSGESASKNSGTIIKQLNRYSDLFTELQSRCKNVNEDFTSQFLRLEFDKEFKKIKGGTNTFFDAYDNFMESKIKLQSWAPNTIKRYTNLKGILKDYESYSGRNLTFNSIDMDFLADFTDYCINKRKTDKSTGKRSHGTNTFRRNIGLFKSFMLYSLKKGFTYQEDFKEFKKMSEAISEKIALKTEDLTTLMDFNFNSLRLERSRDLFVFQCATGMRYGEMKLIGKHNIINGNIILKEEKGNKKKAREVPLNNLSEMILRKYNYILPLIANQKQNEYIKDVFQAAGYTHDTEEAISKGNVVIRNKVPFYKRISTHTARRTFITVMMRERIPEKLIASISGHRDTKTLNKYYQVQTEDKKNASRSVFGNVVQPLRKVD